MLSVPASNSVSARLHWREFDVRVLGLALGLAAIALLLYTRTLQPTLGGMFNSEEYQYAAYSLSLAHSTGYPLFLLLGKLWVTILPFGDIAFRMNAFSALWAILATIVTFLIIRELTSNLTASVLGALIFATNEVVWRYASVAEVDTLTAFLAGSVILSLLLWRSGRLRLEFCGLIYGFSLVHHRTSVLYAPGILLFVFLTQRELIHSRALLFRTALLTLAPLLIYLYVPLRAASSPGYVYDLPSLINYIGGISTTTGGQFSAGPEQWLSRFDLMFHTYLWDWFAGVGILLALFGFIGWSRARISEFDNAPTRLLFGITFVLLTLFTIPAAGGDMERYLLVPVLLLAVCCGLGAVRLVKTINFLAHDSKTGKIATVVLMTALFGFPIYMALSNYPKVDFSQNYKVYQFWNETFDLPIQRNALIIGNWSEANAMRYMQRVEERRPDLQVVATALNSESVSAQVADGLKQGRAVYLTPSDAAPNDTYHYSSLGTLLQVSKDPNLHAPSPNVTLHQAMGPLTLVGFDADAGLEPGAASGSVTIEPGRTARLTLYWLAGDKIKYDYQIRIRLLDQRGITLWQKIEPPLRGLYPMTDWRSGEYVSDAHGVYIPPGTPPGDYLVETALVNPDGKTLSGPRVQLEAIKVSHATEPLAEQVFLHERTKTDFGNLELFGFNGAGTTQQAGQPLDFSLGWTARTTLAEDYSLRFSLVDSAGKVWHQVNLPVVYALPTSGWQQGDAFKEYYTIQLPDDAPEGKSSLRLAVLDHDGNVLGSTDNSAGDSALFSITITR